MAFFTDKFLNDRREELLRSVDRFQYQLNGGAWQTGTVNSKEIIGTNVVVFVNVPNFGQADTITGVRVYDINGALAGQQSISLKRTSLNVALLRYFNPIGAHESGLIGEDPKGIPNNLVPYVAQVAVGKLAAVGVFGDDYPTPDGTGVRDYIHVVDLARGHVAALDWMGGKVGTGEPSGLGSIQGEAQADGSRRGVGIFNLGTGKGSSVLDVIHAFERACGKTIPYEIKPRRAGDIATNYAACDKAKREMGWVAQYDLDRMCADSWRWQSMNPDGYATKA